MAKKNFTIQAQNPDVYASIIGSKGAAMSADKPALDIQDVLDAQEAQSTQGKKGAKMPRINMAFTPSNLDFIRTMAAIRGQSMTQYVNDLIERERLNSNIYEAAKKLMNSAE
ncbi:MAG: hypothetical protein ACLSU1_10545 [[Eubacterium] siraeum]